MKDVGFLSMDLFYLLYAQAVKDSRGVGGYQETALPMQLFFEKLPCRSELMKMNGLGNGLCELCEGPKDADRVSKLFGRALSKMHDEMIFEHISTLLLPDYL